jgi:hypothetical protein
MVILVAVVDYDNLGLLWFAPYPIIEMLHLRGVGRWDGLLSLLIAVIASDIWVGTIWTIILVA